MWEPFRITHNELKGRVRAVSLPAPRGRIAVWTDHGYHTITYKATARIVRVRDQDPKRFDPVGGILQIGQALYPMYGQWKVDGKLQVRLPEETPHPAGERVEADPLTDTLVVYDPTGAVRQRIPHFHARTEPWAFAAFSKDGRALLVADPRGVRLFEFFPDRGRENARWKASGSKAERDALMAAIIADPDDDTPRLVYADWLQENGDEARAEFIRLQCPPRGGYDGREWDLWAQFGRRWVAELPVIRGLQWSLLFVRGFPTVTVKSGATLARNAEAVWAASPVEHLTLTGYDPAAIAKLAACPYLARVRTLILQDYDPERYGLAPLRGLLASPHLTGLCSLKWGGWSARDVRDEGVRLIAACPGLPALVELDAGGTGEEAALVVARSPHLKNLRRLSLAYWQNWSRQSVAELKKRFPDQNW